MDENELKLMVKPVTKKKADPRDPEFVNVYDR
jgi:hypothetical protein